MRVTVEAFEMDQLWMHVVETLAVRKEASIFPRRGCHCPEASCSI